MTAYERYLAWSPKINRNTEPSTAPEHQPQTKAELAAFLMFDMMWENGVQLGMYGSEYFERMDTVIERMAPVN